MDGAWTRQAHTSAHRRTAEPQSALQRGRARLYRGMIHPRAAAAGCSTSTLLPRLDLAGYILGRGVCCPRFNLDGTGDDIPTIERNKS